MAGLIGNFVAGVGQTGAQLGTEAIRSMIEEDKAARLMEMQNKFQVARDVAGREYGTSERVAGQEYRTGERVAGQEYGTGERVAGEKFRSTEAEKADTRATDRLYVAGSIAEEADVNRFDREQPNKDREFAQRDRQIGISGASNSLARERFQWDKEQAELGKAPVVQNDGTIGFVKTAKDADGNLRRTFAPLMDADGKPVKGPKNLSESNKIIYGAQAKIAAEGSNPEVAKQAADIMRAIEMNPSVDFGAIKLAEPGGAKGGPSKGDAKFEDMKREGAKASPMSGQVATRAERADPAAELLNAGQALEASNAQLKALGNQMRLTDGGNAASARAAYLQLVRDIQTGKADAPRRSSLIPQLIGG